MERIVIWGAGNTYKWYYKFLKEHMDAGSIEILAIVSRSNHSHIDGIKVIRPSNVIEYDFDRLVLCVCEKYQKYVYEDIQQYSIIDTKIIGCSQYIKTIGFDTDKYNKMIKTQVSVLKEILNASNEQVSSVEWIKNKIKEYGVYPLKEIKNTSVFWTQWGILQIIDEFAHFCAFISQKHFESVIEIGVYKGRSSYFICALLTRVNPNLRYICVDIADLMDSFAEFHRILPGIEKCIPTTSYDFQDVSFDMVFIDANHSYDSTIQDYLNVGCKAKKLTVFHDIYAHEYDDLNGGTVRAWNEVMEHTSSCKHHIFSNFPDEWMGIGVIEK